MEKNINLMIKKSFVGLTSGAHIELRTSDNTEYNGRQIQIKRYAQMQI
jgi:hypothetical protein